MTTPVFEAHDYYRKAIELSGLSVGEFADAVGVSRNTVSGWINGRRGPSKAQLMAISVVSGVPLAWLETADEKRPPAGAEGLARPKGLEPLTF